MAITIVVEDGTGLSNANSYISLADADAYFTNRLGASAWYVASQEVKAQGLITASRLLDQEVIWRGDLAVTTSALRWPRNYVYNGEGVLLDNDSVPTAVKNATCELALWLMAEDRFVERSGIGLKRLKVDVIELEFDKYDKKDLIPNFIRRMLVEIGVVNSGQGVHTRKLTRV